MMQKRAKVYKGQFRDYVEQYGMVCKLLEYVQEIGDAESLMLLNMKASEMHKELTQVKAFEIDPDRGSILPDHLMVFFIRGVEMAESIIEGNRNAKDKNI